MAALEPVLVFGDVHCPYQNKASWNLLMQVGRWLKPIWVINLGDFIDFAPLSVHDKNPARLQSLGYELVKAEELSQAILSLKAKHYIYLLGNHEQRTERYLWRQAPALSDAVSIHTLLPSANQWKIIPYRQDYRLGKVYFVHDTGSAGRTATFRTFDTYAHGVVHGHAHRCHYLVEGNASGESHVAAQFGWLGDASVIDWEHRVKVAEWVQGFGIGWHDPSNGHVYLTPVPIVKDTCCVGGKLFKANTKLKAVA